jgi:hypothetical protein
METGAWMGTILTEGVRNIRERIIKKIYPCSDLGSQCQRSFSLVITLSLKAFIIFGHIGILFYFLEITNNIN